MIKKEIEYTYKDFLFSLCGILLLIAGGGQAFLRYLGIIIFILFSAKLLNNLLYRSVFGSHGLLVKNISRKEFLRNKILVLSCYSIINIAVLVVYGCVEGGESIIRLNHLRYIALESGKLSWEEISTVFLISVTEIVSISLFLFIIMLLCNLRFPGKASNQAWLYFIVIYMTFFTFIHKFFMNLFLTKIEGFCQSDLLILGFHILLIVGLVFFISVLLKKYYNFQ